MKRGSAILRGEMGGYGGRQPGSPLQPPHGALQQCSPWEGAPRAHHRAEPRRQQRSNHQEMFPRKPFQKMEHRGGEHSGAAGPLGSSYPHSTCPGLPTGSPGPHSRRDHCCSPAPRGRLQDTEHGASMAATQGPQGAPVRAPAATTGGSALAPGQALLAAGLEDLWRR